MTLFEALPEDTRKAYAELEQMITHLHLDWHIYEQLFTEKEAVETLNKCCGVFASVVQRRVADSIILNIAKIVGPAKTGRFQNLAFETLLNDLDGKISATLQARLCAALETIRAATEGMSEHRNKRIAHADRRHALDPNAALPGVTRTTIAKALELLREFMNVLDDALKDGSIYFYQGIDASVDGHGADAMLLYMRKGQQLFALARQAWLNQITPEQLMEAVRQAGR